MTVSMTQKSAKKKSKKRAKAEAEPSVLGNLRSTRPTRLGGDRRGAAKPRATAAKPRKAKPKAAKKAPATATQTKATAAKRPAAPSDGRPSSTEIVTTAVQAVGELAQIGATVGSQLLRRAARRIPRP
jgi:hypothetical protein